MTTIVTITRHHSGFANVEDRYSIGDNDSADTSVGRYVLPHGYTVDDDVIRDPQGYQCEIVEHDSGRPQLISLAGPVHDRPVLVERRNHPNR